MLDGTSWSVERRSEPAHRCAHARCRSAAGLPTTPGRSPDSSWAARDSVSLANVPSTSHAIDTGRIHSGPTNVTKHRPRWHSWSQQRSLGTGSSSTIWPWVSIAYKGRTFLSADRAQSLSSAVSALRPFVVNQRGVECAWPGTPGNAWWDMARDQSSCDTPCA
jgi:hypothetical protein